MENRLFGWEVGCVFFEATFGNRGSINLIQPVNIQNIIWERQSTVSANLFSTVIFGLKDGLQKVGKSLRLRTEGDSGVDAESF